MSEDSDWLDLVGAFVAAYVPEKIDELHEDAIPLMRDEVGRHRVCYGGANLP